jgi:tetratricopeptide (TPR) repeat protein
MRVYTPQRLFGEVQSSSDILTHEPFLERAQVQREQEQMVHARLALGGYIVARLIDKLLSLDGSEPALEAFRWQLSATKRHLEELPKAEPETAHLVGIATVVPSEGEPPPSLWKSLNAYAYFLEHENRLEESLEVLTLAARAQGIKTSPSEFTAYALFAGRLNRLLARWDAATDCYRAAEQAGISTGDPVSRLRGRLGQGAVDRGRGNLPLARATAEDVVREATELGLPDVLAIAYGDLGAVYGLQGLPLEALKAQYEAFRFLRDPQLRMSSLGNLAFTLREIGALQAAHLAFTIVAYSSASTLVRVNALLELMDLEATNGNRVGFERCRAAAEDYQSLMAPSMLVDYHYKLGLGLGRFGQLARAEEALKAGMVIAEKHQLNTWYFKIERGLGELRHLPERPPVDDHHSSVSSEPSVRRIEEELRDYAAASAS